MTTSSTFPNFTSKRNSYYSWPWVLLFPTSHQREILTFAGLESSHQREILTIHCLESYLSQLHIKEKFLQSPALSPTFPNFTSKRNSYNPLPWVLPFPTSHQREILTIPCLESYLSQLHIKEKFLQSPALSPTFPNFTSKRNSYNPLPWVLPFPTSHQREIFTIPCLESYLSQLHIKEKFLQSPALSPTFPNFTSKRNSYNPLPWVLPFPTSHQREILTIPCLESYLSQLHIKEKFLQSPALSPTFPNFTSKRNFYNPLPWVLPFPTSHQREILTIPCLESYLSHLHIKEKFLQSPALSPTFSNFTSTCKRNSYTRWPYLSSSSSEWANVQLLPRGQFPFSAKSRHILVLYLTLLNGVRKSCFLWPEFCRNVTRTSTTVLAALKTPSKFSQDGHGTSRNNNEDKFNLPT